MTRTQQSEKNKKDEEYMEAFKKTFCRDEVHVHFLGLFDCVNSVGQFDLPFTSSSFQQIPTKVAANVRHAVAINERRIKFKPALFHQDGHDLIHGKLKEVWFAGAHGDIGGGWPLAKKQTRTLSSLPLKWMLDEVRDLTESDSKLKFEPRLASAVERKIDTSSGDIDEFVFQPEVEASPIFPKPHDELIYDSLVRAGLCSSSVPVTWLTQVTEIIPLFSRLEYENEKWVVRRFPPSLGAYRDIPSGADIHPSVKLLFKQGTLPKEETPAAIVAETEDSDPAKDQPLLSGQTTRTV
ncbi:MAG: hypothetical protein Q9193_002894 [Seirophora villosa]